jgi:predicted 3-demethylubiquinone-9 3-methyltransferase (glyoxalase superfamily)
MRVMPTITQTLAVCLWFDTQAEEAADFYVSVFPNSRIGAVARYGDAGREVHGELPGSVLTVAFELDGQPFTALNGGPQKVGRCGVVWRAAHEERGA